MRRLTIDWEDIYASSLKFLKPLAPRQTYKVIVNEAIKLLDADQGTVIMYKNKELVRVYSSFAELRKYQVSPKGRTYMTLKTREPLVFLVQNENEMHPGLYKMGFKTMIFIPLAYGYKAKGVMTIFFKRRIKINSKDAIKLRLLGTMISGTLYKAEQFQKNESAINARDHFIAMASHELKNPLTSILMNAQLIKIYCNKGETPDKHLLDSLVTQVLWLSRLIDETLNMRNLKKETIKYYNEAVSILEVIHLAVTIFEASNPSFTVSIKETIVKSEAIVHADFYKLLQVFANILNNAAKYSLDKKSISITVEKSRMNIITKIADQGIGISSSDLPKIFEGYYQGGKKDQKGLGLGLFLVKQIIENSKGHVSIQSKVNYGTTVTISLPYYAR